MLKILKDTSKEQGNNEVNSILPVDLKEADFIDDDEEGIEVIEEDKEK